MKKYINVTCEKCFKEAMKLKRHILFTHNFESMQSHKCDQCDRSVLNEHGHGSGNVKLCSNIKCSICSFLATGMLYGSFVYKRALVIHQFQSAVIELMLYFTILNFKHSNFLTVIFGNV